MQIMSLVQVEKMLRLLSPSTNMAPVRASERVREATPGPTTLCSAEISPLQETSVYTTLERSAADPRKVACAACVHALGPRHLYSFL